jgi:hypothetical protein
MHSGSTGFCFPVRSPRRLERRFVEAWQILSRDYSAEEQAECTDSLRRFHDLEALELACRRRGKLAALSAQVRLMVMLAETLPIHSPFYVSRTDQRIGAPLSILAATIRTGWKLCKGTVQLARLTAWRTKSQS